MKSEEKKTKGYRDLLVWQKGIFLVRKIYKLTHAFPPEEKFGLMSWMRRAAVSIPSTIAEGQARHTTGSFIQHLAIAEGSLAELDTQLVIAVELSFCSDQDAEDISALITELRRMISALRIKLSNRV